MCLESLQPPRGSLRRRNRPQSERSWMRCAFRRRWGDAAAAASLKQRDTNKGRSLDRKAAEGTSRQPLQPLGYIRQAASPAPASPARRTPASKRRGTAKLPVASCNPASRHISLYEHECQERSSLPARPRLSRGATSRQGDSATRRQGQGGAQSAIPMRPLRYWPSICAFRGNATCWRGLR